MFACIEFCGFKKNKKTIHIKPYVIGYKGFNLL